jgi:hypothetical protein
MCYTFIVLAGKQVCVYQDDHKHMSNSVSYDVMMATTSFGDRNFLAPL